jgi:long-chain acyl-CoA synthetase
MKTSIEYTLPELLDRSLTHFADRAALSFVGGEPMSYAKLGELVRQLSAFLLQADIDYQDKVAIISENTPNWVAAFWAITGVGAVAVPLLPDFSRVEVENILSHSDSRMLFISRRIYKRFDNDLKFGGTLIFLDDLTFAASGEQILLDTVPDVGLLAKAAARVRPTDVASIIYTSGTTGRSKGVMLSHGGFTFEVGKVCRLQDVCESDIFLSLLPLSHVYENVLGMILPLSRGAQVCYMQKPPTPAVLLDAMQRVRPTMILMVPLIIEKIYQNRILPALTKNGILRGAMHVWPINVWLNNMAGKKLKDAFGGRLRFIGIGGAHLNRQTERFLADARMPYSCGYGLTETTSLIFGSRVGKVKLQSVGQPLEGLDYRIVKPRPTDKVGEVVVRWGGNMLGYYKEPDKTAAVLNDGGWFHTGDLAELSGKTVYLRGRSKTMILGPSGENIYPEEIESVLNRMEGVIESVVYERKGKIMGKVYLNTEELARRYAFFKDAATYHSAEIHHKITQFLGNMCRELNAQLNRFSQVAQLELVTQPFEKTATHKIKRHLHS